MAIAELRSASLSLEEIFIKLTNSAAVEEEIVEAYAADETAAEEVQTEVAEEAQENESNI